MFMHDLGKKLKFQNMEDWYQLSTSHVVEHGGATLLTDKYYGSLFNLVKSTFPKHEWIPWKFSHVKPGNQLSPFYLLGFWDDKGNVQEAIRWAEVQVPILYSFVLMIEAENEGRGRLANGNCSIISKTWTFNTSSKIWRNFKVTECSVSRAQLGGL